ncbi:MAG: group II intron reverse transcriptase/maturase [Burkholderiales bacterium]|nr:group II intron reverse transcriptase/maturase [Burkholderiales bacterium]
MSSVAFKPITLERVLARENLQRALLQVERNKGSPGVDGMPVDALRTHIKSHPRSLSESILDGTYRPSPIRRVYIPKDNGEKRPLGIPTVKDRLVQQAIAQVLSEEWEKIFCDMSYGFRPNRDCRQAVRKAMDYVNAGYVWVVDLDLRKFFDTVNHSKLIQLLSDKIEDGRVVSLIHKFLRAPISENGKVGPKNTQGLSQGGCSSPVLANIILHELDVKIESRGLKAVRYADDCVIFTKSRKAAERALSWITKYVETKLFLKVNQSKTKILRVGNPEVQFLGFSFTRTVHKAKRSRFPNLKYFPVVHRKKRAKLKKELKEILDRRAPGGIEEVKRKLSLKLKGWYQYFRRAVPVTWIAQMDEWIRRRIRQLLWKAWKKPERRFQELCRRMKNPPLKGEYAYSSNRYWAMAKTPVIHSALSKDEIWAEGWWTLELCRKWCGEI